MRSIENKGLPLHLRPLVANGSLDDTIFISTNKSFTQFKNNKHWKSFLSTLGGAITIICSLIKQSHIFCSLIKQIIIMSIKIGGNNIFQKVKRNCTGLIIMII